MTQPDGPLNRAQLQQIDELRRTVNEALAHNPSWRELARKVDQLTRDAAPAALLAEWATSMSAAVEPLLRSVGMTAGLTASMDRTLRVISVASARAVEPSQAEALRTLLNSFSEQLVARHPSSSLFSATGQLDEDEGIDIAVPADSPESESIAEAFLEVVAQEAPEVAEAIEAAAESAPPSLGKDRARFMLGWAVFSIVLSAHIAGAVVAFPWTAIIAMLLGAPGALAARDFIDPPE